jgi:hypothetical protein
MGCQKRSPASGAEFVDSVHIITIAADGQAEKVDQPKKYSGAENRWRPRMFADSC